MAEDVRGDLGGMPLGFFALAYSYPIDSAETEYWTDTEFFNHVIATGISVEMFTDSLVPTAWVIGNVNRGRLGMRVPSNARGRTLTEQPGMNVKRDDQDEDIHSDDEVTPPSEGPET